MKIGSKTVPLLNEVMSNPMSFAVFSAESKKTFEILPGAKKIYGKANSESSCAHYPKYTIGCSVRTIMADRSSHNKTTDGTLVHQKLKTSSKDLFNQEAERCFGVNNTSSSTNDSIKRLALF